MWEADQVLARSRKKGRLARLWPFLGPAFIASVAYIDPGNFATNIQGGAKFGYTLLWVILISNLMAMLIQTASAKLGIATGKNLAEQCRAHFPKPVAWAMWVLMELVAMATDLAEFLGAALGFNLLFGMPLLLAGLLTAVVTFLILGLERFGFRPLEAVIGSLVAVVAACYLVETVLDRPAAMLIMAAATFFDKGLTEIGTIEEAHRTLQPLLGSAASWVFGISLLAAGLSSSSVGTMAGQVIMQGFLHWHIPVWIRRLVTMLPSLVVIAIGLDPTRTLVLSQVVLSLGLPFALLPLIIFTSRRDLMGVLVNQRLTTVLLWLAALLIIALNLVLLVALFWEA